MRFQLEENCAHDRKPEQALKRGHRASTGSYLWKQNDSQSPLRDLRTGELRDIGLKWATSGSNSHHSEMLSLVQSLQVAHWGTFSPLPTETPMGVICTRAGVI